MTIPSRHPAPPNVGTRWDHHVKQFLALAIKTETIHGNQAMGRELNQIKRLETQFPGLRKRAVKIRKRVLKIARDRALIR